MLDTLCDVIAVDPSIKGLGFKAKAVKPVSLDFQMTCKPLFKSVCYLMHTCILLFLKVTKSETVFELDYGPCIADSTIRGRTISLATELFVMGASKVINIIRLYLLYV